MAEKVVPYGAIWIPTYPAVGEAGFKTPAVKLNKVETELFHDQYEDLLTRIAIYDTVLHNILAFPIKDKRCRFVDEVILPASTETPDIVKYLPEAIVIYQAARAKEKLHYSTDKIAFGGFIVHRKEFIIGCRLIQPIDLTTYDNVINKNVSYDWKKSGLTANNWQDLYTFYADVEVSSTKYRTFSVFGLYAVQGSPNIDAIKIHVAGVDYPKDWQKAIMEPVKTGSLGDWLPLYYIIITDPDISLDEYKISAFVRSDTLYIKPVGFVLADRKYLEAI